MPLWWRRCGCEVVVMRMVVRLGSWRLLVGVREWCLGLMWPYRFSEPCNGWEQGRRRLALTVDAVKDEDEFLFP